MNTLTDLSIKGGLALHKVFERFNIPYGDWGIAANIAKWANNKRPIIDTLRKHPQWHEEALAVVMNITESRGDDASETLEAIDKITNYLWMMKNLQAPSDIVRDLRPHLLQKNITQECVDAARARATPPPVMPSVGMKTSRFIRKLCESYGIDADGDEGFRTRFARYADSISPYDVVRPFIFSVNPSDYALMSYGNSWTSCQSIIPDETGGHGEYRAGCFSYMNDGATIVSYTVENLPDDLSTLCLMPKYCRQLYYLSDDGKMFIQSRSYPSVSKETRRDMRRVAHSILSTVYGFDNMWGPPKRGGSRFAVQDDQNHYPDYSSFSDSTTLSYASEIKDIVGEGQYHNVIRIGESPMCMLCGEDHVAETSTLYCNHCDGHCDDCDEDDDDGAHWLINEYDEQTPLINIPTDPLLLARWNELLGHANNQN